MIGVSVVAPAYNEEATIIENIRSLLSLHYGNYEVIIINDGSKDNTVEVINSILSKHSNRCFLIDFKENSGKANTIFKAINQIKEQALIFQQ